LSIIIPKIIIIYDDLFEKWLTKKYYFITLNLFQGLFLVYNYKFRCRNKGLTKKYYFVTLNLFQGLFLVHNYKFRCRNESGMTLFGQPQIQLSKNVEKQPED